MQVEDLIFELNQLPLDAEVYYLEDLGVRDNMHSSIYHQIKKIVHTRSSDEDSGIVTLEDD